MKNKSKSKSTTKRYTPNKEGNPFFACRVPGKVLRAFDAYAKKHKTKAGELVAAFMASTTGVAL